MNAVVVGTSAVRRWLFYSSVERTRPNYIGTREGGADGITVAVGYGVVVGSYVGPADGTADGACVGAWVGFFFFGHTTAFIIPSRFIGTHFMVSLLSSGTSPLDDTVKPRILGCSIARLVLGRVIKRRREARAKKSFMLREGGRKQLQFAEV
jgi:hypothetical protein